MLTISDPYLPGGVQRPDGDHPPYVGHSPVPQGAPVLHRRGPQGAADVLRLGGKYIHCGEPMHAAGSELRSVYAPMTTEPVSGEQTSQGALEVYLHTRVLHCGCGFQMEISE
jgi:hypothetical protein